MRFVVLILVLWSTFSLAKEAQPRSASDLCIGQKNDYNFYRKNFLVEYQKNCIMRCIYTPTMTKNSDNAERVAGTYFLNGCDLRFGRLVR